MDKWTPFWFASNRITKRIESPDDWNEVLALFIGDDDLGNAKEAPDGHGRGESKIANFGFRIEHSGYLTLSQWAGANNMILEGVNKR